MKKYLRGSAGRETQLPTARSLTGMSGLRMHGSNCSWSQPGTAISSVSPLVTRCGESGANSGVWKIVLCAPDSHFVYFSFIPTSGGAPCSYKWVRIPLTIDISPINYKPHILVLTCVTQFAQVLQRTRNRETALKAPGLHGTASTGFNKRCRRSTKKYFIVLHCLQG